MTRREPLDKTDELMVGDKDHGNTIVALPLVIISY